MDLVARYCQGEDEQFAGVPCSGYDRKTGECAYLRTGRVDEVFEQARCPAADMVRTLVRKTLQKLRPVYALWNNPARRRREFTDHVEALTYLVIERLTRTTVWKEHYALPALSGYLKKTVAYRLNEILEEGGDLNSARCGWCVHLSHERPFRCTRRMLPHPVHGSERQIPNPRFQQRRRPSSRACRNGFEPWLAARTDAALTTLTDPYAGDDMRLDLLIADCLGVLEARHFSVTGEKRRIYQRYLVSFARIVQLCLYDGVDWRTAPRLMAEEQGISEKQVKRDIAAIVEFLRSQHVLPRRNQDV